MENLKLQNNLKIKSGSPCRAMFHILEQPLLHLGQHPADFQDLDITDFVTGFNKDRTGATPGIRWSSCADSKQRSRLSKLERCLRASTSKPGLQLARRCLWSWPVARTRHSRGPEWATCSVLQAFHPYFERLEARLSLRCACVRAPAFVAKLQGHDEKAI